MKNEIMKLIFGKKYKKQSNEFWKKFWINKLIEIRNVFKSIGIVLGYIVAISVLFFILVWFPAFKFLHKEYSILNIKHYKTEIVVEEYIKRTNAIIHGPIFINKTLQNNFINTLSNLTVSCLNNDDGSIAYTRSDCPEFSTINEAICKAIGRMDEIGVYNEKYGAGYYSFSPEMEEHSKLNSKKELIEFHNLLKDNGIGTFGRIKITLPIDNNPIFVRTNTNIIEIPNTKLKVVYSTHWVLACLIIMMIYGVIFYILHLIQNWLKSNYEKLLKEKKK